MKDPKDFFREGRNPRYYGASGTNVEIVRQVLNNYHVDFEEVEHTGIGGAKSIRFYVETLNENVTNELNAI